METFDDISCEEYYHTEEFIQWIEELEIEYANSLLQLASEEYKIIDI